MNASPRVIYATTIPRQPVAAPDDYDEQKALAWLDATNSTLHIKYTRTGSYFQHESDMRDVYTITLRRNSGQTYTFEFGNSVVHSARTVGVWPNNKGQLSFTEFTVGPDPAYRPNLRRQQPSAYSVLACIGKHNPGTFDDFCCEYGYNNDSIAAKKIYEAVCQEWLCLSRLYTPDEIATLAEIQ
jgi:hypothetical protein